ncbi:MAG: hypothetical protein WC635_01690 [Bacteriovorax sp.]|jgi:hypothetical protein
MIAEKKPVFHDVSNSAAKSGERNEVRDSSNSRIKAMREREFRQRQKRARDIEIERAIDEKTY